MPSVASLRSHLARPVLALLFAAGLSVPLSTPAETEPEAADTTKAVTVFQTLCATCHGQAGEGKKELLAPSIAGLPSWYVELQLWRFREGIRGNEEDTSGATMRAVASAISAETIPGLAIHVSSLPPQITESEPLEDEEAIAELYLETCAPCHRYNGHGEVAFRSAPIILLPTWYLESALFKFRDGIRGKHAEDELGVKMRNVTEPLSDETLRDLAQYIGTLAKRYPPGERRARVR